MPAVQPNETLDLIRKVLAEPQSADFLRKAGITQATGLVFYDLRAPAKSIVPIWTLLRNELPRRQGRGGTGVNWKAITAINTTKVPAGVSEGNRNAFISLAEADKVAAYRGLGHENFATFEADYAAENFDDVKARAAQIGLQALMLSEEQAILGGNTSLALGTTPTPVLSTATTGGSIGATVTVSVICVALTNDGFNYASMANGVVQTIARTNADASTDTINGGTAQKSAAATVATGAGTTNSVSASVAVVPGAVAYAWFSGTAGSEKITAITTLNSVVITALPSTGQTAASLTASDFSRDALMFDGLLTYAFTSTNGGYLKALADGTPGTGTALTSDGANGVNELNDLFSFYWDNFRLSPTDLFCNAHEQQAISKLVIPNGGNTIFKINIAGGDTANMEAGGRVTQVLNPITGDKVQLRVHANMPKGTILSRVRTLPPGTYRNSNIGETVEIETRREYYQLEWPMRSRKYEYGVYVDETPIVWAPFALGAITNIGG